MEILIKSVITLTSLLTFIISYTIVDCAIELEQDTEQKKTILFRIVWVFFLITGCLLNPIGLILFYVSALP